jgi:hypothetical protein
MEIANLLDSAAECEGLMIARMRGVKLFPKRSMYQSVQQRHIGSISITTEVKKCIKPP